MLASPPGFSQRATSFIASWRQGIHQMPLPQRLIAKPVARRDKPRSDDNDRDRMSDPSPVIASNASRMKTLFSRTSSRLTAVSLQPLRILPIHPVKDLCAIEPKARRQTPCASPIVPGIALSRRQERRCRASTQTMLRIVWSVVEVNGIEPMTSCLQSRRSPN